MTTGRLLILDDDLTVGQTLQFSARACGYDSRLCGTIAAFLAELANWSPSHVAIDLRLPDGSGRDVLRAMAARQCTAAVIVCSGAGRDELEAVVVEAAALGLSVAGLLAKPFRLAGLKALLAGPP